MSLMEPSVLFIDAYDSFTNNIVAQLNACIPAARITIIRIDTNVEKEFGLQNADFIARFDAIILGPGPGDPRNPKEIGLFSIALDVAEDQAIPLLGICLGFQALCLRHGLHLVRMPMPCHGQTKPLTTTEDDIFGDRIDGREIRMMSYNSLAIRATNFGSGNVTRSVSPVSDCSANSIISAPLSNDTDSLRLLAWDDEGYAMAVRHRNVPMWGLQFHPESCMSCDGQQIVANWWMHAKPYCAVRGPRGPAPASKSDPVQPPQSLDSGKKRLQALQTSERVYWTMAKFRNLNSQDISNLCYDSVLGSPIAMLESTSRGRHCIYGFTNPASMILEYASGELVCRQGSIVLSRQLLTTHEALSAIEKMTKAHSSGKGCPSIPFWGGWIGFMSYEMGLDLLEVASVQTRTVPDFSFVFVERSIVLDQVSGSVCIQSIRSDDEQWVGLMKEKLDSMNKAMTTSLRIEGTVKLSTSLSTAKITLPEVSNYQRVYEDCNENLHAGNSYELCLTSEAQIDLDHSGPHISYQLYQNLNKHNPVPFAAFLQFPSISDKQNGTTVLSTSPEQFLSCSRTGILDMIPMKGTVQRTPTITAEEVSRILQSPKETGENLMIADLIRHDLHSVVGFEQPTYTHQAQPSTLPSEEDGEQNPLTSSRQTSSSISVRGGLSILKINSIVTFDTVYQLVSHIRANPPLGLDIDDPYAVMSHNHSALHHVLPPGSMTGAPKKRSCEILHGLEQRNRGVYSGIIGFMDVGGGCSWSVAIRTAFSSDSEDYITSKDENDEGVVEVQKRKVWHVGAGGAVTVLSNVEGEWEEMMGKMNNVLKGFRTVREEFPRWKSGRGL